MGVRLSLTLIQAHTLKSAALPMDVAQLLNSKVNKMKRKDILDAIQELMVNSNVEMGSKLWNNVMKAFVAISLNKIEE